MASVTIYKPRDPRFAALAQALGISRREARGIMEDIWDHCTEEQVYSLPPVIICAIAELNRTDVGDKIVESLLGERLEDGTIRVRGTKGRIEWLGKLRNNGKKGGRKPRNKTNPEPDGNQSETNEEPDSNQRESKVEADGKPNPNTNPNTNTKKKTPEFDFEAIYEKYPRKPDGHTEGIQRCKEQIKTQEDYDALARAVDRYAREKKGTDPRYLKHFDSFLGTKRSGYPWRDFIGAPDAGDPEPDEFTQGEWVEDESHPRGGYVRPILVKANGGSA